MIYLDGVLYNAINGVKKAVTSANEAITAARSALSAEHSSILSEVELAGEKLAGLTAVENTHVLLSSLKTAAVLLEVTGRGRLYAVWAHGKGSSSDQAVHSLAVTIDNREYSFYQAFGTSSSKVQTRSTGFFCPGARSVLDYIGASVLDSLVPLFPKYSTNYDCTKLIGFSDAAALEPPIPNLVFGLSPLDFKSSLKIEVTAADPRSSNVYIVYSLL